MRQTTLFAPACVGSLTLALLAAAGARADDLDMLQGTWVARSAALGKLRATPAQLGAIKVEVNGNQFTLVEGATRETVRLRLHQGKRPRQIDFNLGQGKKERLVWHGIYKFAADGHLELCWGPAGASRPTTFRTRDRNQRRYYTFVKQ
jgi:uncharacterized protein (TIGR03067 family)